MRPKSIILAALIAIVVIGIFYFAFLNKPSSQVASPAGSPPSAPIPLPPSSAPSGGLQGIPAPGAPPAAPAAPGAPAPVHFSLLVEQTKAPETSMFPSPKVRAYLSAQLGNVGGLDAHNTRVIVQARVGNDRVNIDGKDTYVVEVGTLPARSAVQRNVSFEVNLGFSAGSRAQSEGITFDLSVTSTETTESLPALRCTETGCTPA